MPKPAALDKQAALRFFLETLPTPPFPWKPWEDNHIRSKPHGTCLETVSIWKKINIINEEHKRITVTLLLTSWNKILHCPIVFALLLLAEYPSDMHRRILSGFIPPPSSTQKNFIEYWKALCTTDKSSKNWRPLLIHVYDLLTAPCQLAYKLPNDF